jgi:hypothetical protein
MQLFRYWVVLVPLPAARQKDGQKNPVSLCKLIPVDEIRYIMLLHFPVPGIKGNY